MDTHWRNTQKPARFFAVDARASAAIFLFLVHARLWTICLAVIVMFIFWAFERHGLTFEAAMRAMRAWFLGRNRPGILKRHKRRWVDFG